MGKRSRNTKSIMKKHIKSKKTAPRTALTKGRGLGNPAVAAVVAEQTASVIPFIIKLAIVGGLGYWAYGKITGRFQALKTNPNYPASNISDAEAITRANAIKSSLATFDYTGNEFTVTRNNLKDLNYNGFIKVYNAFGKQSGHFFSGNLNLIEWIFDQFDAYEIQQLRALSGGAFF